MHKLLIADSAEPFVEALTDALRSTFNIRTCADGDTALEMLLQLQPDFLILNLQLPYKDGLTVLQEAAFLPEHILVTTNYVSPYVHRTTSEYGVAYTMISPCVASVRVRIMDMLHQKKEAQPILDLRAATTTHLHILNFLTHMDGYQQLCEAIPLFYQDPHQRLTKELYPAVAEICGCKDGRSVEHSIRKAIEAAWKIRNHTVWCKYFSLDRRECPTNKEFISAITQMLHM